MYGDAHEMAIVGSLCHLTQIFVLPEFKSLISMLSEHSIIALHLGYDFGQSYDVLLP